MCLHKISFFTEDAIASVVEAIGDRTDVEFIILDDSTPQANYGISASALVDVYDNIQHIKLPKIDLLNKLIIGTQMAKGKYYCNVDYDDISHPNKFEMFDKLLEHKDGEIHRIAGANQCVFWDVKNDKTYKLKDKFKIRTHLYIDKSIKYPWLQHSNSAIPLKWLRKISYDGGKRINMAGVDKQIITDSPIWATAALDGLKFGFFDDIDKNAWKGCWQIITGQNVNLYDDMNVLFEEVDVEKPEVLK